MFCVNGGNVGDLAVEKVSKAVSCWKGMGKESMAGDYSAEQNQSHL